MCNVNPGFELRQYQFEIVPDLNRNTKRNWNQKREKWKNLLITDWDSGNFQRLLDETNWQTLAKK